MSEYSSDISRELKKLTADKMTCQRELESTRKQMEYMLHHEMGKDINNVLSGKIVVKLSLYDRLKYNIKYFFDKLFNIF